MPKISLVRGDRCLMQSFWRVNERFIARQPSIFHCYACTSGDSTTNIFDDPHFAHTNLLSCIFCRKDQENLVDLALHMLEYTKKNDSIATTDFWHGTDHSPKTIDGVIYAYSNFQTILLHLKQAGMIKGKKFGRYTLSRKFSYFLDKASDCWRKFYRAEHKLEDII